MSTALIDPRTDRNADPAREPDIFDGPVPEDTTDRFRYIGFSVIIPVRARPADESFGHRADCPYRVGGPFQPGRYQGLREIAFGDGARGLCAFHRDAKRFFSRRLWLATGAWCPTGFGRKDDAAVTPLDGDGDDAGIGMMRGCPRWEDTAACDPALGDDAAAGSNPWNWWSDCHVAYLKDKKIAELRHCGEVSLRAVDLLRFTGADAASSHDFAVAHVSLMNAEAGDVVEFSKGLRKSRFGWPIGRYWLEPVPRDYGGAAYDEAARADFPCSRRQECGRGGTVTGRLPAFPESTMRPCSSASSATVRPASSTR